MPVLGSALVDFSGVTLPFNASDLLDAVMGLVGVLGPFVLLGLAILFTPRIFTVIRAAVQTRSRS